MENVRKNHFQCTLCPSKFTIPAHFEMHKKIHNKQPLSKVGTQTGKVGNTEILRKMEAARKQNFQCNVCPQKFSNLANFQGHIGLHAKQPQKKRPEVVFKCDQCPKAFVSKEYLNLHVTNR